MYIQTMKYYPAIKNNGSLSLVTTWMETQRHYASGISQIKERQILYNLTYIWDF